MRALMARALAVALVVVLGLVVGCGGKPSVQVRGTFQKDGKPYQFAKDEQVQITFSGVGPDGIPFSAGVRVKDDGTFILTGPANRGVPPGTYKITLSAEIYGPKNDGDRFRGAFSDEKSPLSYAVTAESVQEIVVDVGKKTVTKK
jgi:hypothetical protein